MIMKIKGKPRQWSIFKYYFCANWAK